MSQMNIQREALNSQLRSIESDASSAYGMITSSESRINSIDSNIGSLQGRLLTIRGRGYSALAYLEKNIDLMSKKWAECGPVVKQAFYSNVQPYVSQIQAVQAEIQRVKNQISTVNFGLNQPLISHLATEASTLRARVTMEAEKAAAPITELERSVNSINQDLRVAEKTIELFSQASFPLRPDENQVLAIEGKIMTGEKNQGTIYFTDHRFLFEGKKEIVLEKKLFIVTKKRTERTVIMEQPVGALQEISKGRVGLIAWSGIFVRFKPGTPLMETSFDVKGWEADTITRFFSYIVGGEAERDINQVKGKPEQTSPTIQIVRCMTCNAPYTHEIFKGQTSVKCDYCGTQIVLS